MSSDVSCEESSVRERASYDEAFGSGDESEDFLTSSERGTSARSPDGNESDTEGGKDEVEKGREDEGVGGDTNVDGDDSDGDNSDRDEGPSEGVSEGPGNNCPFILPEDWAVNKFLPRMSNKVLGSCVLVIKSQTTSQSVSLKRMRLVTQGEPLTWACMMPCLLRA